METNEKTSLTDSIISAVKKGAVELEELRVQAALGKMEASDLYEESRKKFNNYIHEAKISFENFKENVVADASNIKALLEALQVQLALGKAETRDAFEEQRKKITGLLNELETAVKKNATVNEYYVKLIMEIEKFKIKLDILKLRFELKKIGAREEFEERKSEFMDKVNVIREKLLNKKQEHQGKWEHFQDEITEAYQHLKKAFVH